MPMPTMLSLHLMLTLVPLVLAVASSDSELRASFERFDRLQSPTAARTCALFLNIVPVL